MHSLQNLGGQGEYWYSLQLTYVPGSKHHASLQLMREKGSCGKVAVYEEGGPGQD